MHIGDRLFQFRCLSIRIDLKLPSSLTKGIYRVLAGAERRLICRQLVDLRDARSMFLAGDIGCYVKHTGFRSWAHVFVVVIIDP